MHIHTVFLLSINTHPHAHTCPKEERKINKSYKTWMNFENDIVCEINKEQKNIYSSFFETY